MRKNGKIFLKELYAQQTDHRGALACVGSERFSGIRFVCLGFSVFLWCKESVHLPVVDAAERVPVLEEKIAVANHRIEDLEKKTD